MLKKNFHDWYRLGKTKQFLEILSSETGIPLTELIMKGTGNCFGKKDNNKETWVHPQVAINIAQWISPKFAVMVSEWIYELCITGKLDINNTNSYKELKKKYNEQNIKINLIKKIYLKKQPRKDYLDKNCIYLLTTNNLKKERKYILGKTINLKNRLSTYNKTDDHEVIYYKTCESKENMDIIEKMILKKLEQYKEKTNRERLILPECKTVDYFKNIIDENINFLVS